MYYKISLKSFNIIDIELKNILLSTGLCNIHPGEYFLYGTFIRSLWSKENYNRISVAFKDPGKMSHEFVNNPYLSISKKSLNNYADLLDQNDFVCSQIVYHDGYFYYSKDFYEHIIKKIIIVNTSNKNIGLMTFFKALILSQKGFVLPKSEFDQIIKGIIADHNCYHLTELVKELQPVLFPAKIKAGDNILIEDLNTLPELQISTKKLRNLSQRLGLKTIFIYGSFIRSIMCGEPCSDIDIAVQNKKDWELLHNYFLKTGLRSRMETDQSIVFNNNINLCKNLYESPEDIIKGSDFVMSLVAIDLLANKIAYSEDFYMHMARKLVIRNPYLDPQRRYLDRCNTLYRLIKYVQRGYKVPISDLMQSIMDVNKNVFAEQEMAGANVAK